MTSNPREAPEPCPRCAGAMEEWTNEDTGASVLICQRVGCTQSNLYRMPPDLPTPEQP